MAKSNSTRSAWFDTQGLQEHVDYQTWARGQSLFLHGKVLSYDVTPDGVSWVISGEVQGTQVDPYEVQAEITLDPQNRLVDWFGTCSCPVGEACKHAVAMTIKAGFNGLRVGDAVVPAALVNGHDVALRAHTDGVLQAAKARLEKQAQTAAEAMAERLYRVDASRSSDSGGSGLGLAIAHAIVEGHGGRMQASASALGGLRWDIWLPLNTPATHG